MKNIIYKIAVLLLFIGWSSAYAADLVDGDAQYHVFLDTIMHNHLLLYSLFCGFVSILVKIVDYVIENHVDKTDKQAPVKKIMEQAMPLLGWFISAMIVGYLGAITGFLSATPQTAVMVGIAWPIVYSRLKKAEEQANKEDEKQTEQEAEEPVGVGILPDLNLGEEQVTSNECYDVNENEVEGE
jgi:hypothetical protein